MKGDIKEIPIWLTDVWVQSGEYFVNPLGIKTKENRHTIADETGTDEDASIYACIEGDNLVFNRIYYKDKFFGKELGALYLNQYCEFEKEGFVPSLDYIKNFFTSYERISIYWFMAKVLSKQDYYNDFVENDISINQDNALYVLDIFLSNTHKNFPLLVQESMWGYISKLFSNGSCCANKLSRKSITISKKYDLDLDVAIELCEKYNPQEVSKFLTFINFVAGDIDFISCYLYGIQLQNFTKFCNYFIKSLMVTNNGMQYSDNRAYGIESFLEMYRDYLRMVEREENPDLYPDDLRIAHDAAIDRNYVITAVGKYNKVAFLDAVEKYSDLAWIYENYSVVIPTTPEDLVQESKDMHHCVKSYIGTIIAGETKIVLVRKDGSPYMTIEINNINKIIQAKKKFNELPNNEDEEFLSKYAKEKNLVILRY